MLSATLATRRIPVLPRGRRRRRWCGGNGPQDDRCARRIPARNTNRGSEGDAPGEPGSHRMCPPPLGGPNLGNPKLTRRLPVHLNGPAAQRPPNPRPPAALIHLTATTPIPSTPMPLPAPPTTMITIYCCSTDSQRSEHVHDTSFAASAPRAPRSNTIGKQRLMKSALRK